MPIDFIKVILPGALAFTVGIGITPFVAHYLYRYKAWKKTAGKVDPSGQPTPIFNELHKNKEVGTPRMGGIIIWVSALLVVLGIWLMARLTGLDLFQKLDFLSRDQTWLPLFALMVGSLVGLIDDYLEIRGAKSDYRAGGMSLRKRLFIVMVISFFVGWWLYTKLDVTALAVPFAGPLYFGIFIIPIVMLVTACLYAGGIIDGLDGLAGGVFASAFAAYAGIAFFQDQINLAALSATIAGAILAFLWFNIPPARFYMSETGSMGLTLSLSVIAFMTDTLGEGIGVAVLPLIAFPLVITVFSVVVQLVSKKLRGGKKVFLVAPLHHHFEAIGWPAYKVTMRYWVIAAIGAMVGILLALSGQ